MELLTIQLIITLLLALSVVYLVYKEFRLQYVGEPHVPCIHQHICDDKDVVHDEYLIAAIEKENKAKELEKRRREYREWMDNCNKVQVLREREQRAI